MNTSKMKREELEALLAACEPYLKPQQTPADRMKQDHEEILGLMRMLQQEKERVEKVKWALQDAVTVNAENCRQRDKHQHDCARKDERIALLERHLIKAIDMIADMNGLINNQSGTVSFAAKMVEQAALDALAEETSA